MTSIWCTVQPPATHAGSPAAGGFRMPAEWEPHERTWMGWPTRPDNWRGNARYAQAGFAAVARAIAEFEPLTVAATKEHLEAARKALPAEVNVVHIEQDDAWFRDVGPTFVVRDPPGSSGSVAPEEREVAGIDWIFTAWGGETGGLYPSWERDQAVARRILEMEGCPRFPAGLVMEGGSFHVDGKGTLLTTEECLLNKNRNPELTRDQIATWLQLMLGVKKIIWLPRGLEGDVDTNGHVDNMACFARPGEVLLAWTDDVSDPQHARSAEALAVLEASTDAAGRRLRVIKVPCPPVLTITEEESKGVTEVHGVQSRRAGDRLAASYINFFLCNGGLIMPGFGGEAAQADARAKAILQNTFPERKVVQIESREILLGGGNIHCITQQRPVGRQAPAAVVQAMEGSN